MTKFLDSTGEYIESLKETDGLMASQVRTRVGERQQRIPGRSSSPRRLDNECKVNAELRARNEELYRQAEWFFPNLKKVKENA